MCPDHLPLHADLPDAAALRSVGIGAVVVHGNGGHKEKRFTAFTFIDMMNTFIADEHVTVTCKTQDFPGHGMTIEAEQVAIRCRGAVDLSEARITLDKGLTVTVANRVAVPCINARGVAANRTFISANPLILTATGGTVDVCLADLDPPSGVNPPFPKLNNKTSPATYDTATVLFRNDAIPANQCGAGNGTRFNGVFVPDSLSRVNLGGGPARASRRLLLDRRERAMYEHRRAASILVLTVLLASAPLAPAAPQTAPAAAPVIDTRDAPSLGADGAPVIVEFGDFQCPACAQGARALRRLVTRNGDRVRWVFKHYPLRTLHPQAAMVHEAAIAAQEQGKFWEMHDLPFQNQKKVRPDDLLGYAEQIGLDLAALREALNSRRLRPRVIRDMEEGRRLRVFATPTYFVNGERHIGARTTSEFLLIVNAPCAGQGSPRHRLRLRCRSPRTPCPVLPGLRRRAPPGELPPATTTTRAW